MISDSPLSCPQGRDIFKLLNQSTILCEGGDARGRGRGERQTDIMEAEGLGRGRNVGRSMDRGCPGNRQFKYTVDAMYNQNTMLLLVTRACILLFQPASRKTDKFKHGDHQTKSLANM